MTVSPVCALLTAHCTPELERVQAELGAHTSFRDASRILDVLLPASSANHESLCTRIHAVALQFEAADRQAAAEVTAVGDDTAKAMAADTSRPVVMLDGAYVRAVPGHQVRNFEAICGKVERDDHSIRCLALVRSVVEQPHALLRAALHDQGWRKGDAVTEISDGDPALPAMVRSATGGLCVLEPPPFASPDQVQTDVERLRHLLWHDHHEKACEALGRIADWAKDASVQNDPAMRAEVRRLAARCTELQAYIETNKGALIDYGQRYRAGKPISTSRAEGTVNQMVNARMNKCQHMRWSPRGAHRVHQVKAAVLDGRLAIQQSSSRPSAPGF